MMLYDIMTVMKYTTKRKEDVWFHSPRDVVNMKQAQLTIKMWREREQSAYQNMESCLSSAVAYHGIVSYIEYPGRGHRSLWLWCKYRICTIPSLCLDGMATSYWAGFWMPLACYQKPFHCTCQCIFACMISTLFESLSINLNMSL